MAEEALIFQALRLPSSSFGLNLDRFADDSPLEEAGFVRADFSV
jgi:hypothetical protein